MCFRRSTCVSCMRESGSWIWTTTSSGGRFGQQRSCHGEAAMYVLRVQGCPRKWSSVAHPSLLSLNHTRAQLSSHAAALVLQADPPQQGTDSQQPAWHLVHSGGAYDIAYTSDFWQARVSRAPNVHIAHMRRRPDCLKTFRLAQRSSGHYPSAVAPSWTRPSFSVLDVPCWWAVPQATCTTMHNILCDPAEASIWEAAWESYKASGKAYGPGRKKPGCGPARPTDWSKAMPVSRVHAFCCIHYGLRHCSTVHVHGHSRTAMLLAFCSGSARECCLLLTASCCTVCRKSGVQLLPLW